MFVTLGSERVKLETQRHVWQLLVLRMMPSLTYVTAPVKGVIML